MSAVCPVCKREQNAGLLCHECTSLLERELGDVAALVADLDITLSRQARIGAGGGGGGNRPKGWARERLPINLGAVETAANLGDVLTKWARGVSGPNWMPTPRRVVFRAVAQTVRGPFCLGCEHPSCERMRMVIIDPLPPASMLAATRLLSSVPAIRRHPDVAELVDEVAGSIKRARRAVDRPVDRIFVGPCMMETPDEEGRQVTCLTDLYAREGAGSVRCPTCYTEHPVAERQEWLLRQAASMLFTVRESAQMLGDIGGIRVTEDRIRGYLRRGRIVFHSSNLIRLGDLLDLVVYEGRRKEKKARVKAGLPSTGVGSSDSEPVVFEERASA